MLRYDQSLTETLQFFNGQGFKQGLRTSHCLDNK